MCGLFIEELRRILEELAPRVFIPRLPNPRVLGHSAESTSYGLSVSASYAAILSATLASMMCRINRRFLSTNASLSARQLSSNTPTA